MDLIEAIVLIAVAAVGSGGALSVIITQRMKRQEERAARVAEELQKKNDERYAERVEWEWKQLQVLISNTTATEKIINKLTDEGICNGDMAEVVKDLHDKKVDMFEHINKTHVGNVVKS